MWPINYENLNKLHMSIGIGLLVAAFLLLLSSSWWFYDKVSELDFDICLNEDIPAETREILIETETKIREAKISYIESTAKRNGVFAICLSLVGFIFFLLGYVPFRNEQKRKKIEEKIKS